MFVVSYIVVCVILTAIVYWGAKNGKLLCFLKKHSHIPKVLTLGYIISAGCFMFPIRSDLLPLDFLNVYLLVVIYGVITLALARILGSGREWMVYMMTFVLTAVGMVCRYLLNFGEESNTYNFTLFNIISYLVIIPIGTMIAYHWIARRLKRR